MTDRYMAFTVVLDKDIREDDAEYIVNALKAIKHVLKVTPVVSNIEMHVAEARVRLDLERKLWAVIHPDMKLET